MALRSLTNLTGFARNILTWNFLKASSAANFSTSVPRTIKTITHTEEGNQLIVEGHILPSDRANMVVKIDETTQPNACYMCRLNLDVKHTDVLILSQFVRSDGCMLPRRITGLCKRQQIKIGTMVTMAQKAGLMSNFNPSWSKKNPRLRQKWKKWNSYWDESTIKW